jgi:hypothetical protein
MSERRADRTGLSRLRPLVPLGLLWSAAGALLLGLVLQREVPYDRLLLDPTSVSRVPWYTGLVSNLGVLGWTTAAATGFFGAWIARYGDRPSAARLLGRGATLTTILLLDDLFQLHVIVKPLPGVTKPTVYVLYLVVAGWWVGSQWPELRRTRAELLAAAGAAFAVSIGVDQLGSSMPGLGPEARLVIEDAGKFLGVLAWAQYFVLTSGAIVTSIVTELRGAAARPGSGGEERGGAPDRQEPSPAPASSASSSA